jgi:hypothetical protein
MGNKNELQYLQPLFRSPHWPQVKGFATMELKLLAQSMIEI